MIKNFDPRLKILIVMVLSSVSFVMTSEVILSFYYLIAVSLFLIIGAFKKGSGVFIYALGLFGVGKFFVPICPLSAGALLDVALFFLKRMSLIFVMLMWLQTNMKTGHFIATVQKLKIPKGMIITIAVILRYRPTLKIEISEIKMAMKLRGVNFSLKNILRRPLSYSGIFCCTNHYEKYRNRRSTVYFFND